MTHPDVRYPAGPITPHGAYHILHNRIPQMALRAYDDSVVFHLMGGLAIPDRTMPERVEVKNITGLVPPWRAIEQKGATQDGTTFIDALYDPAEVGLDVVVHGRDRVHARRVYRDLVASIDAKQPSELSWTTHDMGRWWAPVRWMTTPPDNVVVGKRQPVSLRLKAHNAFWESYPSVAEFSFTFADDGMATSTLNNRTATARKVGYTGTSNNQVAEIQIGRLGQWFFPSDSAIDIWLRMANSGTIGADGVRLRIESHNLRVSYFTAGVETLLREQFMLIPPLPGDRFTFVAGTPSSERSFQVKRGGAVLMNFKETGTGSPLGSTYRAAGFGLHNGSASVRSWSAGDNITAGQSAFLPRYNVGDQDMWDRFTCFGPGTFKIWDGPNAGANEYVQFGPLLANQVAQVRTDPRKYGVKDLTSTPNNPQEEQGLLDGLLDFLSFGSANNAFPLLSIIQSVFGIFGGGSAPVPPQGNLYQLLAGRFSNPIPPKSPGRPAEAHHVKVEISGGNAHSKIIAAGTPLRRNPY